MTVSELLKNAAQTLTAAGVDNAPNEARWLLESMGGFSRERILFDSHAAVSQKSEDEFRELISKRASGVPVQYLIGEWDFCGETFKVGNGVLIPREETGLLVDFACDFLKGKGGVAVVDLCAGSGCIGLTAAKRNPGARFYLVEKFDAAFAYLEANVRRFGLANVSAVRGDLFSGVSACPVMPDLLLSNPPYIASGELPGLQREVLREPATALDGGEDGLDFYRAIAAKWLSQMPSGSACAVECGEGQAEQVAEIFSAFCSETGVMADFNNIRRVVTARVKG